MRLSIVHDGEGNIVAITACPDGAPMAHQVPKAGESVTHLDVPEMAADLDRAAVSRHLGNLAKNHRVDAGNRRVVKK
jgi:hypothetical protein